MRASSRAVKDARARADDLVLHMGRHAHVERVRAARMRQSPVIQQADEALALKAAPILPQLMIRNARRAPLLRERSLALEDGAQPFVAG